MNSELHRIASYHRWQGDSSVSALELSRNGFCYLGSGDEIECVHCKTRLIGWSGIRDALKKHREAAPGCPLVRGEAPENVLREPSFSTASSANSARNDGTGSESGASSLESDDALPQHRGEASSVTLRLPIAPKERTTNRGAVKKHHGPGQQQLDPDSVKFKMESERFKTFHNWPASAVVDPRELARQGFFYTGREDRVQCAFCGGYVYKWERGDNPAEEHKKHHPSCPFVRGIAAGNIPTVPVMRTANATPIFSNDAGPDEPSSDASQLRSPAQQQPPICTFPAYMDVCRRVDSFKHGTIGLGQTAKRLADAGFFYVGPGDMVQCFHCGGKLNLWKYEDDPWMEHRRSYERCSYIQTHQPSVTARAPESSLPTNPANVNAQLESFTHRTVDDGQPAAAAAAAAELPAAFRTQLAIQCTDKSTQHEDAFAGDRCPSSFPDVHQQSPHLITYNSPNSSQMVRFNRDRPHFPTLDDEGFLLRFLTFYDWDDQYGDRTHLASQGLFSPGSTDSVVCSVCGVYYPNASLWSQDLCFESCQYANNLDAQTPYRPS